jgi:hypothetical protein
VSTNFHSHLDSIHFLWDTESFLWDKHFDLLVKVQSLKKNPDDPIAFRKWVTKQRDAYREGTLSKDRIDRLNAAGFHWGDNSSYNNDNVNSNSNHSPADASASSITHYDSPEPFARSPGDRRRSGGSASAKQKQRSDHYHHHHPQHDPDDGDRLPLPGSALDSWDSLFKALVKYKKEYGHANVPPDDRRHATLAAWCRDVRALHRRKELGKDKIRKLKSLGFKWANRKTGPKASWEERFSQLKDLLRQHRGMENLLHYAAAAESLRSRSDEPSTLETIVSWVDYQRVLRKHSKLDQDKIDRLTAVGLVWDAHQAAWDARYKQLVAYTEHGTKPRDYSSYVKWEHRQRREYRLGTLNNDRIERLNAIGFRWEPRPTRRRASNQSATSRYSAASSADNDLSGRGVGGRGRVGGGPDHDNDGDVDADADDTPDPRKRSFSDDGFEAYDHEDEGDGNVDDDEDESENEEEEGHEYAEEDDEADGYYSYNNEGSHSVSSLDDSRRDDSRRGRGPLTLSSRKRASPYCASLERGGARDHELFTSPPTAEEKHQEQGLALSSPPSSRRVSRNKRPRRSPSDEGSYR